MRKEITECPICSSTNILPHISCMDYTVSLESFSIKSCSDCDFKFTDQIPSEEEIGPYYQSEDYVSHSSTSKGLINKLYKFVRKRSLKKKQQLVQELSFGNSIIDYGAGTGHFLKECVENGWNILGFEPSVEARAFALDANKIQLQEPRELDQVADDSIDVITLWHVLEHIHDLKPTLQNLYNKLKPGGKLVIAVPNCNSADSKKYKSHWAAYDVPRHLYHFTQRSMETLMKEYDLKKVDTKPMVFDAYYVSLLSEKYKNDKKTGIKTLLNGFFSGLYSNIEALETKEYSSLIYIYEK